MEQPTKKTIKTLFCVYEECGQKFTTEDEHFYHEETDLCYCSEGCYEAQVEIQKEESDNSNSDEPAEKTTHLSNVSYTKQQVQMMNDDELIHAFIQVTGKTTLACKHCHYKYVELERFVESIRRRCYKNTTNGLRSTMMLPKTCDFQAASGLVQGAYYRKYYRAIKNGASEDTLARLKEDYKHAFPEKRREFFRR